MTFNIETVKNTLERYELIKDAKNAGLITAEEQDAFCNHLGDEIKAELDKIL